MMKWQEIKQQHPNKFILLGNVIEEKIHENKYRILEGSVFEVSDDGKEIIKLYRKYKKQDSHVLFSLPTTPSDFIIEDIPVTGINYHEEHEEHEGGNLRSC
jgi:hypothetical protein